MDIPETQIPDTAVFLDDPQRRPLEIDTEQRRGPALFRWLTLAMEHVIATLLLALIVSVSINVVGRAVLNNSVPWADELARMLFIWLIFIGAAAAFARYEHIAVDILVRRLPPRAAHMLYLFQHVIITLLMGVIIWGGSLVMVRASGRTAILNVPWSLVNVSVVLCAIFIAAVAIWRAWQSIQQIRSPDVAITPDGGR
ncbi:MULTISPECIES: TRAP transporter small permease [unclassified Halomonas]|uniref:TRAP transporter small permease n=1 Tax=unclassified Halomonas TaxID=2609666 RepID=UPI0006DAD514|nr:MULTISPECIES: TRAP transporter small permease [unclassified Halomonas]KPQ22718.1 MAG: TRAP-type C4-dicarboxylate transport system, small permease component [Halomonas sp. HL-93]SBR46016.1 TRAP-type C4-dicarboxylate transport system, small permease component [Halomonas sp. HL-93]SNY98557.1 TRAP-type C4-dicarboxylate transport system, small permease component [Halomonas sp. hl-4]